MPDWIDLDDIESWCSEVGGEFIPHESGEVQWHIGGGMDACKFPDGSVAAITKGDNNLVQYQPSTDGYATLDVPGVIFEAHENVMIDEMNGHFGIPTKDGENEGLFYEYKEPDY